MWLGADGHLAFNEPGSSFNSVTRIKTLTPQTIKDNSRFLNLKEHLYSYYSWYENYYGCK